MTGTPQYLLVLYRAERRGTVPVPSGVVAEAVGRSPAATTEMLQRLDDRGLVTHEPYDGATLTAEGRERAADLYGTYVTLSRFFDEVLDLPDHEREAMSLVGVVSPTVVDRLATTLLDADVASGDDLPDSPRQ